MTTARSVTSTITAADGTPLLVRHWPTGSDRWAQMLLIHGLAEHSGRYERTSRLLADAGIVRRIDGTVEANQFFDHQGQLIETISCNGVACFD